MSTSSKKKTQKKNDVIGNNDNNVAKVNTTSYTPEQVQKVVKEAARINTYKKMGLDPNYIYGIDKTKSGPSRLQPIKKRKK